MGSRSKRTIVANPLISTPKMRNFASCLSEHAVKISDYSCSGGGDGAGGTRTSVTNAYVSTLSTSEELLIVLTWRNSLTGSLLAVTVDERRRNIKPDETKIQFLQKKKGTHHFISGDFFVSLYWDLSSARYSSGPEPSTEFYVIAIAGGEVVLRLGDSDVKKFEDKLPKISGFTLLSRTEHAIANETFATKARFREGGKEHEILIRCKTRSLDANGASEMWVCVDGKKVVHVTRLQWSFRGNHVVFVDGLPVDLMWDVLGWWSGGGAAAFLFRHRSSDESQPLLEDETPIKKHQGNNPYFSLLIQISKGP